MDAVNRTPAQLEADRLVGTVRGNLLAAATIENDDAYVDPKVKLPIDQVLAAIWQVVKNDPILQKRFPGLIRRITAQGAATRELLTMFEYDPEFLHILAVGTVQLPKFATAVSEFFIKRGGELEAELREKYGDGYDLYARGPEESRRAFIEYTFSKQWGVELDNAEKAKLLEQTAVLAGGMNALKFIFEAAVNNALNKGKKMEFALPDNSFGTAWNFLELLEKGRKDVGHKKIQTKQSEGLHLTGADVDAFYDENDPAGEGVSRMWYITPVGNPSGTSMTPEQFYEVCSKIVERDSEATIFVDEVYVGTMNLVRANALMAPIIADLKIRDRIIHLNSLSKSHGQCGRRVAMYTSFNKDIFDDHHSVNTLSTAGAPAAVYADAWALDDFNESMEKVVEKIHKFWNREKIGLFHYLSKSGNFGDIFHEDQSHIRDEDLNDCTTIYLCLRLRDDIDLKEGEDASDRVLARTGCLGVPARLAGGQYLRMSLGELSAPTYAKYAPDYQEHDDDQFLAAA